MTTVFNTNDLPQISMSHIWGTNKMFNGLIIKIGHLVESVSRYGLSTKVVRDRAPFSIYY